MYPCFQNLILRLLSISSPKDSVSLCEPNETISFKMVPEILVERNKNCSINMVVALWSHMLTLGLRPANEKRRYFVRHLSMAGCKPRISSVSSQSGLSSVPCDAIWWHRSGSTLVKVMASCLMQWWHQFITLTNIYWSSVRSSGIHLMAISQEMMRVSKLRI